MENILSIEGVQELTLDESKNIEGGSILAMLLSALVVGFILGFLVRWVS